MISDPLLFKFRVTLWVVLKSFFFFFLVNCYRSQGTRRPHTKRYCRNLLTCLCMCVEYSVVRVGVHIRLFFYSYKSFSVNVFINIVVISTIGFLILIGFTSSCYPIYSINTIYVCDHLMIYLYFYLLGVDTYCTYLECLYYKFPFLYILPHVLPTKVKIFQLVVRSG